MSSNAALSALDRRDAPLESALETITEGRIRTPNTLQFALFPRLMTQDTGLLIPTGPCAGRLEAVFIPYMMNVQPRDFAHRLYIITADDAPLDDYLYRLGPYMRSLVAMDGVPRTFWLEEPERTPIARRYFSDGSTQNGAADHPFSQGVDVVAMPFSHFRSLFFGTGGVYGIPEVIGFDKEMASEMKPRGLFYFDDSFGPTRDEQLEFVRMVEFLFAQDLDVIVGSSSMPRSVEDELSFLELLSFDEIQGQPDRTITFVHSADAGKISNMAEIALQAASRNARIMVVLNDPNSSQMSDIFAILDQNDGNTLFYRSLSSRSERTPVYAELKQRERNSQGYILITDGPAVEASDLDATILITEICPPLDLLRRAGRCNRSGSLTSGSVIVVGDPETLMDSNAVEMAGLVGQSFKNLLMNTKAGVNFNFDEWASLAG